MKIWEKAMEEPEKDWEGYALLFAGLPCCVIAAL
jgi:hypothetical protein